MHLFLKIRGSIRVVILVDPFRLIESSNLPGLVVLVVHGYNISAIFQRFD